MDIQPDEQLRHVFATPEQVDGRDDERENANRQREDEKVDAGVRRRARFPLRHHLADVLRVVSQRQRICEAEPDQVEQLQCAPSTAPTTITTGVNAMICHQSFRTVAASSDTSSDISGGRDILNPGVRYWKHDAIKNASHPNRWVVATSQPSDEEITVGQAADRDSVQLTIEGVMRDQGPWGWQASSRTRALPRSHLHQGDAPDGDGECDETPQPPSE